jgi:hypothetical protein
MRDKPYYFAKVVPGCRVLPGRRRRFGDAPDIHTLGANGFVIAAGFSVRHSGGLAVHGKCCFAPDATIMPSSGKQG